MAVYQFNCAFRAPQCAHDGARAVLHGSAPHKHRMAAVWPTCMFQAVLCWHCRWSITAAMEAYRDGMHDRAGWRSAAPECCTPWSSPWALACAVTTATALPDARMPGLIILIQDHCVVMFTASLQSQGSGCHPMVTNSMISMYSVTARHSVTGLPEQWSPVLCARGYVDAGHTCQKHK